MPRTALTAWVVFLSFFPAASWAGPSGRTGEAFAPAAAPDTVIVRFSENAASGARMQGALAMRGMALGRALVPELGLYEVRIKDPSLGVRAAVTALSGMPGVVYAQPDHYVQPRGIQPDDPDFGRLWSLKNPDGGPDVSATSAWEISTGGKDRGGNDLVVAIVDGGMDLSHTDLRENLWVNAGETPGNGADDDGNGYVDDVNGWDAYENDATIPVSDHGTHVAGISGARGDNGRHVAGVNWDVKIMAVAASSMRTSVISAGYGYVLAQKRLWLETGGRKGANVVATNSSFGVDYAKCETGEYPVWNDLYGAMGQVGILSAAATINSHVDVDKEGDVPTGCGSDFLVTVTNTTRTDEKNRAGYGARTIDLGAPGTAIFSTVPGDTVSSMTGTSMATPHVAGAIALMHSAASQRFYDEWRASPPQGALRLKELLLQGTDRIRALEGITVSGGRLNLRKALEGISRY